MRRMLKVYAGPAVRKLARELGVVVLAEVKASGPHERLMKEDLFAFVKTRLTAPQVAPAAQAVAQVSGLPKLPSFDAFGGVEEKTLDTFATSVDSTVVVKQFHSTSDAV